MSSLRAYHFALVLSGAVLKFLNLKKPLTYQATRNLTSPGRYLTQSIPHFSDFKLEFGLFKSELGLFKLELGLFKLEFGLEPASQNAKKLLTSKIVHYIKCMTCKPSIKN
jgi:hypothetical protein